MKKAIVLSVLGIAASGYAAFGQGVIAVNNYVTSNYNADQVKWGANTLGITPGTAATPTQGVTVQIFYALGNVSGDTAAQFLAVATPGASGVIDGANPGGAYGVGPYGYYGLGNQLINGWTSGSVTFAVEAWVGASYATATASGISALFVAADDTTGALGTGIRPSSLPAENFLTMNSVTLAVPEPTTIALGGLGLAALLAFRRKQV